jgi:pyruvate/2-oxoglutarate dehydrogenase complex dihydrolipoamide dehydrogenase (E3) component
MVVAARPDVVILATGGIPLTIPFPGLEETHWLLASDLLEGTAQVETQSAFIIGGGLIGLEVADYLAAQGKRVTLVEMLEEVGSDMDILAKNMLLKRLKNHDVGIHSNTEVTRLTAELAITLQGEREVRYPIETVVLAVGVCPNQELPKALEGSDMVVHVIGDAVNPRKALEAIWEGFEVGNKI